jgi:hypothetical protein
MNPPPTQQKALLARARRLLHDHQTRARKDGVTLDYTIDDLRRLIASSPCCYWCRLPVAFDLQLDHLQPVGRGGLFTLDNLCVSHARCNQLRGMLTEAETVQLLAFLARLHPVARQDVERRLTGGGTVYARGRKDR